MNADDRHGVRVNNFMDAEISMVHRNIRVFRLSSISAEWSIPGIGLRFGSKMGLG